MYILNRFYLTGIDITHQALRLKQNLGANAGKDCRVAVFALWTSGLGVSGGVQPGRVIAKLYNNPTLLSSQTGN